MTLKPSSLFSGVAWLSLVWQECCENPAVFCYRIGWTLVAEQTGSESAAGNAEECCSHSSNSFTLSTTSKD
jgi:hypothetical protein